MSDNEIDLNRYQHPLEKAAINRLEKRLLSKEYCAQLLDLYRTFELENLLPDLMGKSLSINNEQMPEIYSVFKRQAEILDMDVPKAYVFEGRYCDVNAEGLDDPWIQISTKTLEDFDVQELEYAIARQMIHIKLGHMRYEVLCEQFSKSIGLGSSLITFVPGATVASQEAFELYAAHFKLVASQWSRISEYTADRCALVLCNWNIKAAVGTIKKQILNSRLLANNMTLSRYLRQTDTILAMDTPVAQYSIMDELYPYGPFRIKELISFASLADREM